MLAHNIKQILEIAPEAMELVKQANLEEEFPTNNKDSVVASALRIEYLTKVAHKAVDYEVMGKVAKAVDLYGIGDDIGPLIERIGKAAEFEKVASMTRPEEDLRYAEVSFEGSLTGIVDLEKAASVAQDLYENYGEEIQSDIVKTFAGKDYLNKEAALGALVARYQASKNPTFVKIASALRDTDEYSLSTEDKVKLGNTITALDKQAHLDVSGFNFWKEAFVKEAALSTVCTVQLAGIQYPYEKIQKLGKDRIASAIGKDVAGELTGNPAHDKQVLETLPLDLKEILSRMLKAV